MMEVSSLPQKETKDGFSRQNVVCLAILCFVNLINYMDRYTVSAILDDVSAELCAPEVKCSTQKEGLLQTAFVLVYFVVAPIFGYMGDRYSRKYIMAGGVLVWGGISLSASFMTEYWSFLALRASIAIGESAFTTIAPTVLGDLFSESTRPIVLGVFYLAIPAGSGLGYVVGSAPENWHNGLRITPGLNLLGVILILAFMVDPPRGDAEHHQESSYKEDLKYILGVKSFLLNVAGFTCVTFTTGALSWYGPTYLIHGLKSCNETIEEGCDKRISEDSVAFLFGVTLMISGIVGVLSGMMLSKFLRPKYPRIDPLICGVSLIVSCPLIVYAVVTAKDDVVACFAIICLGTTFLNMNWSISVDMTLYVIVPQRRATAEAIHLMATHALGEAGSPYIIGLISDALINRDCPDLDKCENLELTNYMALQQALFLAFSMLVLGGVLFCVAAIWIVPEKLAVDRAIGYEDEGSMKENKKLEKQSS